MYFGSRIKICSETGCEVEEAEGIQDDLHIFTLANLAADNMAD